MKRILTLGGTGMPGHVLVRHLSNCPEYEVYGTTRSVSGLSKSFPPELVKRFRPEIVDADIFDSVIRSLASIQPDIVINCIGLIKQLRLASNPLSATQLPHRISLISRTAGARMIHISTDCVFNGLKGNYSENDPPCAEDLYGQTKYLGEVNCPHCVTLRTSIIGHELKGGVRPHRLVFSPREGHTRGYTKAIYSGFPTIELARIITDFVVPNEGLCGTYHVSSNPISKHDLLKFVAERYGKRIEIEPYYNIVLDRSMNSSKFLMQTGYNPPTWPELVDKMYLDYDANRAWYEKKT